MSESLSIGADRVVSIHYTLTDDAGTVIDRSGDEPLGYLHGHGNLIPGLENALVGLSAGDEKTVSVPPSEAYGDVTEPEPQRVPKSEFGPDADRLQAGMQIVAQGSDGSRIPLWIHKVEGGAVWVTHNHPLAGKTLTFAVKVADVREAAPEELSHGHVHGPGGHQH